MNSQRNRLNYAYTFNYSPGSLIGGGGGGGVMGAGRDYNLSFLTVNFQFLCPNNFYQIDLN